MKEKTTIQKYSHAKKIRCVVRGTVLAAGVFCVTVCHTLHPGKKEVVQRTFRITKTFHEVQDNPRLFREDCAALTARANDFIDPLVEENIRSTMRKVHTYLGVRPAMWIDLNMVSIVSR